MIFKPSAILKRLHAEFYPASFTKFLIYENYPLGYRATIGIYKNAIFERLPEVGNDGRDFIRDEKRVFLRKRYDLITFANNIEREGFLNDCSDYLTNEIGMKPTKARIYIESLLKECTLKLFPPLPPIEYFCNDHPSENRNRRDYVGDYVHFFDDNIQEIVENISLPPARAN